MNDPAMNDPDMETDHRPEGALPAPSRSCSRSVNYK